MSVIHSSLFHVVRRFPQHKDAIHRCFKEKDDFHVICDDYARCSEALKKWNRSSLGEAPDRRKEYADLLLDLEMEIIEILNEDRSIRGFR